MLDDKEKEFKKDESGEEVVATLNKEVEETTETAEYENAHETESEVIKEASNTTEPNSSFETNSETSSSNNNNQNESDDKGYSPYYKSAVPQGDGSYNNRNKSGTTKAVAAIVAAVILGVVILIVSTVAITESFVKDMNKDTVSTEDNSTKKEKKE